MDLPLDNWTTQLRKGLLEFCILNVLAKREMYGYDLVKRLSTVRGLVISEGTIYPLLSRLRRAGVVTTRLVESPSGPARKYYVLTPAGERTASLMNDYWRDLIEGIDGLQEESEEDHD